MRFGEPMLVCFGVDARGGGNRGVFRDVRVILTSGPEPEDGSVSMVDATRGRKMSEKRASLVLGARVLTFLHVRIAIIYSAPLRRHRRREDVRDWFQAMFVP